MISSFYTYKETGIYGNWLKTLSSNPIQSDKSVVWTFVQTPVRLRTSPQNNMLGSSRGLGLRIFIPATRIRIPYRVQIKLPNIQIGCCEVIAHYHNEQAYHSKMERYQL